MALVPAVGPCSWDNVEPLCLAEEWDTYSTELQTQALEFATMIAWTSTGRQFGLCELTVRPCGRQCANCPNGWYYDGNGGWVPYMFNGMWKNCWCGAWECTCDPDCQVYLPGPVYSIQSVQVGGESIPITGGHMFVLDQQWLVRTDTTECWPLCGDQNLAPGDAEAFEVTYLRGKPVPNALAAATANYAVEYAKACLGLACRLPGRITSLSRQGVTVSMVDVSQLLAEGLTGLMELDQLIVALNPHRLKGRTRMWSPELQEGRGVTWP